MAPSFICDVSFCLCQMEKVKHMIYEGIYYLIISMSIMMIVIYLSPR